MPIATASRLLAVRSKPKKNMLPPFTGWTLHENTRMIQANFSGKVSGSVTENPHTAKTAAATTLFAPDKEQWSEHSQADYTNIRSLNTVSKQSSNNTNGNMIQFLYSFDIIEHIIRNYGEGVFGTALTTEERVAWLKVNIAKLTCNWHGFGSGPSGNKANLGMWHSVANTWGSYAQTGHTNGTVARLQQSRTNADMTNIIDANGFTHFLAYAEASDGTIASTINTDFVELDVVMAAGSIPQPDYVLTLNATAAFQPSYVLSLKVLPNTTYTLSREGTGYVKVVSDQTGIIFAETNVLPKTFTTNGTTTSIAVHFSNTVAGTFTFTNPQLELGSVATDFEPYEAIPDLKPSSRVLPTIPLEGSPTDEIPKYYLQMPGGVGSTIQCPFIMFDEVIMDFQADLQASTGQFYFEGRSGSTAYSYRETNNTDRYSGFTSVTVDGVVKGYGTLYIPSNQRVLYRMMGAPAASDDVNIFSNGAKGQNTKGIIYSVIFKHGGVITAHYDMSTGTVQDQSGNGNHATLVGGTWVQI